MEHPLFFSKELIELVYIMLQFLNNFLCMLLPVL